MRDGPRDVAAALITAGAAGLVIGVAKIAPWITSLTANAIAGAQPWKVVVALAYGVNVASVSAPGRIDGEMQKRAAEAKRAKPEEKAHGVPLDSEFRSLFTPAGWAFAIWGVIYAGEMAMTAHALLGGDERVAAAAPYWAVACGLQSLWCVAFRPWAKKPRHFWVSSALLITEAFALGGATRALRGAGSISPSEALFWTTRVPLSLHFGWISCAALVNVNSHVAKTCAIDTQIAFAFLSAFGASALGAGVSVFSGDAVYGAVVAWALAAVASDGGKRTTETVRDHTLDALRTAASWGARFALIAVTRVAFRP